MPHWLANTNWEAINMWLDERGICRAIDAGQFLQAELRSVAQIRLW
ncbi:hypothetical protein ACIPID_17250 [Cupriavidus sp. CER94]